jgi:hypothetical protein
MGRIPRSTGEYMATDDARHCQHRKVCGAQAFILKRTKNIFLSRFFWSDRSSGEVDMKSLYFGGLRKEVLFHGQTVVA